GRRAGPGGGLPAPGGGLCGAGSGPDPAGGRGSRVGRRAAPPGVDGMGGGPPPAGGADGHRAAPAPVARGGGRPWGGRAAPLLPLRAPGGWLGGNGEAAGLARLGPAPGAPALTPALPGGRGVG